MNPAPSSAELLTASSFRAVLHFSFVLNGLVTTLPGPLIPILAFNWKLNDAQAGWLFIAQAAGAIAATFLSDRAVARLGLRRSLAAGYGLMAAGVIGLIVGPWSVCLLAVLCNGVGIGLTIPATNVFVSETNPARRAAALNRLNFLWSLGAVFSPLLVALLADGVGLTALAALLALTVVLLLRHHSRKADRSRTVREAKAHAPTLAARPVWRNPLLLLIGAFIFLCNGTEGSLAGWLAAWALRLDESSKSPGALSPSVFWGALLLGRISAPWFLRRMSERRLILVSLLVGASGVSLVLTTNRLTVLMAGAALAGAGIACVFPTTLALLPEFFGASAQSATSLICALGGLGGAVLPWLVGVLSTRTGSLRYGLAATLLCCLAMILLQPAITLRSAPVSREFR